MAEKNNLIGEEKLGEESNLPAPLHVDVSEDNATTIEEQDKKIAQSMEATKALQDKLDTFYKVKAEKLAKIEENRMNPKNCIEFPLAIKQKKSDFAKSQTDHPETSAKSAIKSKTLPKSHTKRANDSDDDRKILAKNIANDLEEEQQMRLALWGSKRVNASNDDRKFLTKYAANFLDEEHQMRLAVERSKKQIPDSEQDELQAEIDRIALLAASENEPLWLANEVKNVTSFLEGCWNEIEHSRDGILRLMQRTDDAAWASWQDSLELHDILSIDTTWRYLIGDLRKSITGEIVALTSFTKSSDEAKRDLPWLIKVLFEEKKTNCLASTIQEAANLRIIIEKFLEVFAATKENLLDMTRRIEFEGAFDELELFEQMSSKWTKSAKFVKKYLSSQLETIQEFQKTHIIPIEASQAAMSNLALKDEEKLVFRLMHQIKIKSDFTRQNYTATNNTSLIVFEPSIEQKNDEIVELLAEPAPKVAEKLEENEEYLRNKAEIEALKDENQQLQLAAHITTRTVMPWIIEERTSVGQEYASFFDNFKALKENIEMARTLENSATSFDEMQRHNTDAMKMLKLWSTVADGMRDNMKQFSTAMANLNLKHMARKEIVDEPETPVIGEPETEVSSPDEVVQIITSPQSEESATRHCVSEPIAIGFITVEYREPEIWFGIEKEHQIPKGQEWEKRIMTNERAQPKVQDWEKKFMTEHERNRDLEKDAEKEQKYTIDKQAAMERLNKLLEKESEELADKRKRKENEDRLNKYRGTENGELKKEAQTKVVDLSELPHIEEETSIFCDFLCGTWMHTQNDNSGPYKIVIIKKACDYYEDTVTDKVENTFEWRPDNLVRDGMAHRYTDGKIIYENHDGVIRTLYQFLDNGNMMAGAMSNGEWKKFEFKRI